MKKKSIYLAVFMISFLPFSGCDDLGGKVKDKFFDAVDFTKEKKDDLMGNDDDSDSSNITYNPNSNKSQILIINDGIENNYYCDRIGYWNHSWSFICNDSVDPYNPGGDSYGQIEIFLPGDVTAPSSYAESDDIIVRFKKPGTDMTYAYGLDKNALPTYHFTLTVDIWEGAGGIASGTFSGELINSYSMVTTISGGFSGISIF